jgi:hypothetical protein
METPIITIPTKKYVYFDEAGNVLAVSNSNSQSGNFIEVDQEEVLEVLKGNEPISAYHVAFDTINKKYKFKHKFIADTHVLDISQDIYEIPFDTIDPDITIVEDQKEKQWIVIIDDKILQEVENKTSYFNFNLQFSITNFNDPMSLQQFIKIELKELIACKTIKIPFDNKLEVDKNRISVYTIKKFDSYSRKVIHE